MTNCLTCKYCEPQPGGNGAESGACRFNPPQGVVAGVGPQGPMLMTLWPSVRLTKDWCSHHVVQLVKPVSGIHLEK